MNKTTARNIRESYEHIKHYLTDTDDSGSELREMCQRCERYCGEQHDWEECLDTPCFKFYLAYEYLEWLNSSNGY